ncbi:Putative uncharacterized protein [Pararhodospirillum photometricum DSM 122]|uniref:Deacylase n=2 Tax=Pararhodospirillum photometricum TaxID=1084 RepID=H6SJ74_PARPM|nr:Putative uncharacterized protein [Pararhodospirillum photometricum DSM 122]
MSTPPASSASSGALTNLCGSCGPSPVLKSRPRAQPYLYGGLLADIMVGRHVYVMPNTALGYYQRGGGRDLGYPLEFRSGLEIGWRFDGGMRAGVAMHHLSNANIGDRNPGVEELSLNLSIPLASVTGLVK